MKKNIASIFICICIIFNLMAQENPDYVKLGGAVRINGVIQDFETNNNALDTYMKFDTWFLTVDAKQKGFDLSFQYRFYPEFKTNFLHHGYIGYAINDNLYAKLGIFEKPFGIASTTGHSWWIQMPYYMGLEDTYNMGVGASYDYNKFKFDLAYFRQAAPKGPVEDNSTDNAVGNGRYSYNVIPTYGYANGEKLDADIRELDQFNARVRYQIIDELEFGLSGQLGSIYNKVTNKRNWGFTSAAHVVANYDKWGFKGEVINFNYNASADNGQKLDVIQMGAFGVAEDVATKGMVYTAAVSYTIPINRKFIQTLQPYIDYSITHKSEKGFASSQLFVPGMMATMGPLYVYLDYAFGKNQPALTATEINGLGEGSKDARWNSRLNLNIGYYFDATIITK